MPITTDCCSRSSGLVPPRTEVPSRRCRVTPMEAIMAFAPQNLLRLSSLGRHVTGHNSRSPKMTSRQNLLRLSSLRQHVDGTELKVAINGLNTRGATWRMSLPPSRRCLRPLKHPLFAITRRGILSTAGAAASSQRLSETFREPPREAFLLPVQWHIESRGKGCIM